MLDPSPSPSVPVLKRQLIVREQDTTMFGFSQMSKNR